MARKRIGAFIWPRLQYDKRSKGNRGRCLAVDVESKGLQSGDRLEPSLTCPDVGISPSDVATATPMTFWRIFPDEAVRHRNPLWDPAIGVTPDVLCIDTLHTLALGVFGQFACQCMWWLLEQNPFNLTKGYNTQEELKLRTMQLYKPLLQEFYRTSPKVWTRIDDWRLEILGTKSSPGLHLKGHQTLGFLYFLHWVMERQCQDRGSQALDHMCCSIDRHLGWFREGLCNLNESRDGGLQNLNCFHAPPTLTTTPHAAKGTPPISVFLFVGAGWGADFPATKKGSGFHA